MGRSVSKEIIFIWHLVWAHEQQVNFGCLESIQNCVEYLFEEEKIIVISVEKRGSRKY